MRAKDFSTLALTKRSSRRSGWGRCRGRVDVPLPQAPLLPEARLGGLGGKASPPGETK